MLFSTAALLLSASAALAQLTIVRPAANNWWVANSVNTLQWTGTNPAVFSVTVYNSNTTLLSSGSAAIVAQENAYDLSYTLTPFLNVGTGYTITLHDPQNVTNVYATSDSFEVKPQGSSYPSSVATASASVLATGSATNVAAPGSSTASGSGTAAASASSAAVTSTSKPSGGERTVKGAIGALIVGGLVAVVGM